MNDTFVNNGDEADREQLREGLTEKARDRINRGEAIEDVILSLHDSGLSVVESIWVLHRVTNLSLANLKEVVTAHPIWGRIVQATEPLHDELEQAAGKEVSQ